MWYVKLWSIEGEKKEIFFEYVSGKSEKTVRNVLPLKLLFKSAAWYLYGFCKLREDFRFFKLRRIENLKITENNFEMSVPEKIIFDEKKENLKLIKAKFKISKNMAFRVYDEFTDYEVLENGDFLCEILMPDINNICIYASSFGEFCRIIEPIEAREQLKIMVERMLKNCF